MFFGLMLLRPGKQVRHQTGGLGPVDGEQINVRQRVQQAARLVGQLANAGINGDKSARGFCFLSESGKTIAGAFAEV